MRLLCQPREAWRSAWNWKSALASACCRAPIFLVANLSVGTWAAVTAFVTEFIYRAVAAGFYGALTEYFARQSNTRMATLSALVVLPVLAHGIEYLVHRTAGTPRIGVAVAASIGVSVVTTRFGLFLMRRGLFVARGGRSFTSDVTALGRLAAQMFGR